MTSGRSFISLGRWRGWSDSQHRRGVQWSGASEVCEGERGRGEGGVARRETPGGGARAGQPWARPTSYSPLVLYPWTADGWPTLSPASIQSPPRFITRCQCWQDSCENFDTTTSTSTITLPPPPLPPLFPPPSLSGRRMKMCLAICGCGYLKKRVHCVRGW